MRGRELHLFLGRQTSYERDGTVVFEKTSAAPRKNWRRTRDKIRGAWESKLKIQARRGGRARELSKLAEE